MKKLLLSIIFISASAYQAFCGGPSPISLTTDPNSLFFTAPVSTTTGFQYVTVTGSNPNGSNYAVSITGTSNFTSSLAVLNALPGSFTSVIGISFTSGASSNTKLTASLAFASSAPLTIGVAYLNGAVLPVTSPNNCTVNVYSDNNTITGVGSITGTTGMGDLRYCILLANNAIIPATINFNGTGTTVLKSYLPDLSNSITFSSSTGTTISGAGQFYIFKNSSGNTLTAKNLSFVNAYNGSGGGSAISNPVGASSLLLTNCSFYNNTSLGKGGALYTNNIGASIALNKCIFSHNYATLGGGAIFSDNGNLSISNSSLTSNSSILASYGDVIDVEGGTLKIINTTIYSNYGAGQSVLLCHSPTMIINSTIYNNSTTGASGGLSLGTTNNQTLINNIIVNNSIAGDIESGIFSSLSGHNILTASFPGLSGDMNGNIINATIGGAIFSGGLSDNGGGTFTLPINQSSIALNKGLTASTVPGLVIPTSDQRSLLNFNGKDIGAFEFQGLNQGIYSFGPFSTVAFSSNYVITLTGVSDSGLPVFYSVIGPANVLGNKVNLTGIGVLTITAFQPGNATYKSVTVSLSFSVVASTVTGISNSASSNSYAIYPNPSTGSFTVDTGDESVSITVYNTTGEIVQSAISPPGSIKIGLACKGLYFVGITSKDVTIYKKVILE